MKFTDEVRHAANGKWPRIMATLGIDEKVLNGRNQPCPMCGGTDRFRFTDKDGEGLYYCNGCGPGDAFKLIGGVNGWAFRKTLFEVAEVLGLREEKAAPKTDPRDVIRRMLRECAEDKTPVTAYLKRRGLSTVPTVLKHHPKLPYFDDDGKRAGEYPAMLGTVLDPKGSAQAVHRTYLTDRIPKGSRKKLTRPVRSIRGGAIRLFGAGKVLGVAEGIETAIACYELAREKGNELPMWAVVSATMMEQFQWPVQTEKLVICADNDMNYAGHAAAYKLAHRAHCAGLEVEIRIPKEPGTDWLDKLNEIRRAA